MVVLACQQCGRHAAETAWGGNMAAVHITLLALPILQLVHVGGCHYCVVPQYTLYTYCKFVCEERFHPPTAPTRHPSFPGKEAPNQWPLRKHHLLPRLGARRRRGCSERRRHGSPGFPGDNTNLHGRWAISTHSLSLALSSLASPVVQYCLIRHTYTHNMIKQSTESEKKASTF